MVDFEVADLSSSMKGTMPLTVSPYIGGILITIGGLGVILNVIAVMYFGSLKTETENLMYSKMAFVNMAIIDLSLSILICCIQGPAYIWPDKIWGTKTLTDRYSAWCEFGSLLLWWLSDLNLLGVIPLSMLFLLLYAPCLNLSKLYFGLTIAICWIVPTLEMVFIAIERGKGNLDMVYQDEYKRCLLLGPLNRTLNYENATVFFAIPLLLHLVVWSLIIYFVCRQGNTIFDRQWLKILRTGLIVIVAFTATWIPYFVVVAWKEWKPTERYAFIYCFLYASVVVNPLIYCLRSMRFNGKSVSTILRETYRQCVCRSRTLSTPASPMVSPDGGPTINNRAIYSSYDDIDGDEEMKSTTVAHPNV